MSTTEPIYEPSYGVASANLKTVKACTNGAGHSHALAVRVSLRARSRVMPSRFHSGSLAKQKTWGMPCVATIPPPNYAQILCEPGPSFVPVRLAVNCRGV